MIVFDLIGLGATVMGWWGYNAKFCILIHIKIIHVNVFDMTRPNATVIGWWSAMQNFAYLVTLRLYMWMCLIWVDWMQQ